MSAQVRERVSRQEANTLSVTRMPFGLNVPETLASIFAVVLLVAVLAYYFSSLSPEQDALRRLEAELAEQQRNIVAVSKPVDGKESSPAEIAQTALDSLEGFKSNHVKPFSAGRIDLIKEINALSKKNTVTLTSGIDMSGGGDESSTEGSQTNEKPREKKAATSRKKSDEILSAFPSVSFRFTVFGSYTSMRTFIQDLEREKQFVVINSINLANQELKTSSRRSRGEGMSGILLTIEMSAYFRPVG